MNLPKQARPVSRNYFETTTDLQSQNSVNPSACIGASVNSQGRVCVQLPIIGTQCIPINTPLPRGTGVSACIDLKKTWGIPTGACVTIKASGRQVARQCFGL